MGTTLELDDAVLAVARAKAAADGTSLGCAVSELVRRGLSASGPALTSSAAPAGFPVLRGSPGHVLTSELVAQHAEDD